MAELCICSIIVSEQDANSLIPLTGILCARIFSFSSLQTLQTKLQIPLQIRCFDVSIGRNCVFTYSTLCPKFNHHHKKQIKPLKAQLQQFLAALGFLFGSAELSTTLQPQFLCSLSYFLLSKSLCCEQSEMYFIEVLLTVGFEVFIAIPNKRVFIFIFCSLK